MALITDPDSLSQGTLTNVADLAFTASSGANTTLTGATTLPALATGEFFEIRDSSTVGNNGLYIATGSPTTSSVPCTKVVGPDPQDLSAEDTNVYGTTGAGSEKSVHFDVPTLTFYLLEQGNMDSAGVTMLALHSFAKEEWKGDSYLVSAAAFPMVGISFAAGQWQFGVDPSGNNSGWKPAEDNGTHTILTRQLIRNAGWDEIDASGNTLRKYFNVTTLPTSGAFEDTLDQAYYRFGTDATDTAAPVNFKYTGEVNEPVLYFTEIGNPPTCTFASTSTITRASGSFITDGYQIGSQVTIRAATVGANDGTFVLTNVEALTLTVTGTPLTASGADTTAQLAVDNSNVFEAFLRIRDADPSGKTFSSADLAAGGETAITSKIIKLGLGNVTDNDVDVSDAGIGSTPYTQIRLRYLPAAYNRAVDSATLRDYGIVVDVGTYSESNGVTNGTTTFTSANWPSEDTLADFAGGTLILHDATAPDRATHTISGTPTAPGGTLTVVLTAGLTNSETSMSFTMQRATPIAATKQQIYEKIHYQLRQATDIDQGTGNAVVGKTADDLAVFSGPDLRVGSLTPTNPNGGGTGVIIEGFDTNDTNNLFFFDNSVVSRNFPFVAAGTITVNQGLVDDTDGEAWLYFAYTRRTTNSDIDTVGPAGDTYDLEGTLGTYLVNDYLQISGFAQTENNGLFIVTVVNVSGSDYTVRKVDGTAVGTAETNQTVNVDENPYPSPDAIVVNDNSGSPIAFNISTLSTSWDFDYENNVQGGRTADTNAAVVLVAAGLETGQVAVVKNLTITKTTGQSFSITSALERNYAT